MKWSMIKHKEISKEQLRRIAAIKDQHWPYGIKSQIQWSKDNTLPEDLHLFSTKTDESLVAYLTLNNVHAVVDDFNMEVLGIGSVCVSLSVKGQGVGKELINEANNVINKTNKLGLLLCKDSLVGFYKKCGWHTLKYKHATVAKEDYNYNIMTLGSLNSCERIIIDRNF